MHSQAGLVVVVYPSVAVCTPVSSDTVTEALCVNGISEVLCLSHPL